MKKERLSLLSSGKNLFNIKPVFLIIFLIILGIITGLIVSNYYFNNANNDIKDWNDRIDEYYSRGFNSS